MMNRRKSAHPSKFKIHNLSPMHHTIVIGLETHVQLLTKSKLFCGCVNRFNPENPNVQTCPVCLGLPGSLPVMNREAFLLSVKTGLALNCDISHFTKWDRKQYYYPDLPKAYQISQYDLPFSHDGFLEAEVEGQGVKRVGIIRAHLEEDAGKNMHDETGGGRDSRVDLNRCGTPLLEIVSEPDLRSAAEAKAYLDELKLLLNYLGVSDCNMQEGSLRCDANVNLHIHGDDGSNIATPIVEVKNLNSFRGVEQAIDYEANRQLEIYQETGRKLGDPGVHKETRGWDANRSVTFAQRSKEEASDYRYLPDPDLVPITLTVDEIDEIRQTLCEFPADRRRRFSEAFELSDYDVSVIVNQGAEFADYFETVAGECGDGKQAANWCTQDVQRELNERNVPIGEFPVVAAALGTLLAKVVANEITTKSAREVFADLLESSATESTEALSQIDQIIEERGLAIVSDTGELEGVVETVLAGNQKIAADFRSGKQGAIGPLIGQVMREVKGADAKVVRQMLIERIGE